MYGYISGDWLHTLENPETLNPISSGYNQDGKSLNAENDPNFIEHFFESSRLHFIGTWRSRLPSLFAEFSSKYDKKVSIQSVSSSNQRIVLHVDMDCFFVSVLTRERYR